MINIATHIAIIDHQLYLALILFFYIIDASLNQKSVYNNKKYKAIALFQANNLVFIHFSAFIEERHLKLNST